MYNIVITLITLITNIEYLSIFNNNIYVRAYYYREQGNI